MIGDGGGVPTSVSGLIGVAGGAGYSLLREDSGCRFRVDDDGNVVVSS